MKMAIINARLSFGVEEVGKVGGSRPHLAQIVATSDVLYKDVLLQSLLIGIVS